MIHAPGFPKKEFYTEVAIYAADSKHKTPTGTSNISNSIYNIECSIAFKV